MICRLQGGMGFSSNQAILLSAPVWPQNCQIRLECTTDQEQPYYYAVIPVLLSSRVGDSKFSERSALSQYCVGRL